MKPVRKARAEVVLAANRRAGLVSCKALPNLKNGINAFIQLNKRKRPNKLGLLRAFFALCNLSLETKQPCTVQSVCIVLTWLPLATLRPDQHRMKRVYPA